MVAYAQSVSQSLSKLFRASGRFGSTASLESVNMQDAGTTQTFVERLTTSSSTAFSMPSGFRDTWEARVYNPVLFRARSGGLLSRSYPHTSPFCPTMALFRTGSDSSWTRDTWSLMGYRSSTTRTNYTGCRSENHTVKYRFRAKKHCIISWPILPEKVRLQKGDDLDIVAPDTLMDWIAVEFCLSQDELFDKKVRYVS